MNLSVNCSMLKFLAWRRLCGVGWLVNIRIRNAMKFAKVRFVSIWKNFYLFFVISRKEYYIAKNVKVPWWVVV